MGYIDNQLTIGKVYDKLTVISYSHKDRHKFKVWNCKCECGTIVQRTTGNLNRRPELGKHCGGRIHNRPKPESATNCIIGHYKAGAAKRNLEFKLTNKEIGYVTQLDCYYCGTSPSNILRRAHKGWTYSGIDRLDNNIGYILSNVVPCCLWCNRMKKGLTYNKFIEQANRISNLHGVNK